MIALLLSLALAPAPATGDVVLDAMKDELARTKTLKLPDSPSPYWASYQVVDYEGLVVTASFGALVDTEQHHNRTLAPRVRVGDVQLDAVGVPMFQEPPLVAYEDDYEGLRHALWLQSDGAYKMAATGYRQALTEKAQTTADPERPDAFTPAEPVIALAPAAMPVADREALEALARRVSAVFREHEHIQHGAVTIAVHGTHRRFASTDGSVVTGGTQLLTVSIVARTQADDGDVIARRIVHVTRPDAVPEAAALEADATRLAGELAALRTAPLVRDYSGPVLFEADAAAEVLGMVLGTQLVASGPWTGEVEAKLGQLVLPKGVDVIDDPAAASFGGAALLGQLAVDDEGTRTERVQLVQDGKLVGLLSARAPGKKVKRSNGHGRSLPFGMDVRPGATNLLVTSKRGLAAAAMEKQLVKLVRERGAEFGIIVTNGGGYGEGATAYRVGTDGKRELVRIGYLRGLELRELRELVAVGKTAAVRHGVQIGGNPFDAASVPAELGAFVTPVSVAAPAILVRDTEIHAFSGGNPKPPAYPRPSLRKR